MVLLSVRAVDRVADGGLHGLRAPARPALHVTATAMTHASPAAHTAAPAAGGFLPHGYCYLWNTPLLLTHVIADVLIGLSYVVISLALVALVHRARRDIPFHVLFVAFGLFIVACGMTHFLEVWTLWHPTYWLSGGVKAITAVASVTTAAVMPRAVPQVLTTIRTAGLARAREVAAARADALAEQNARLEAQARELERQNELLEAQAIELEQQTDEARALADELEQSNRALRAALADAEAARRESEVARRAADAANQAKAQFLATMSHELRTPLNAIGGYAQLLDMGIHGPVTDAQRDALARVDRAQRHLLGLINDILNYAKLEAGRVVYDLRAVSVAHVVDAVAPLIAPQLAAKRLAYDVRVSPAPNETPNDAPRDAGRAWVDPEKLTQVLLNLLSNAIKFTPEGGRISVEVARAEGVRDLGDDAGAPASRTAGVHVRVRDTGAGIAPDKLEAIFEPFVQVHAGQTAFARAVDGTGLGLAISRDLARGMGGDLTAESTLGVGSTFTLTLPTA